VEKEGKERAGTVDSADLDMQSDEPKENPQLAAEGSM
jgi:hypothetical protein